MWLLSVLFKKLFEAKLKNYELTALTGEISRQPSIDHIDWLLVASLMQICNEQEQAEQGKTQKYSLRQRLVGV